MTTDRKNTQESKPALQLQPKLFQRLALHTAIATAVLTGAYGRNAYAGSCSGESEAIVCSGAADPDSDVTQTSLADNPVITTEAGFGIETSSGSAFLERDFGSFSFTDAYQSGITGQENGIDVSGYGDINITSTGAVTGVTGDGIYAVGRGLEDGALTINAANISAYSDGINADQEGVGDLFITATGTITTENGDGIAADTISTAGDIVIHAADVYGGSDGIEVDQDSIGGDLFITSTGTVTGRDSNGIEVSSNDEGGDIVINAVNAYGHYTGIEVLQDGVGDLTVTATGIVRGTVNYGIYADNDEQGGNIAIAAADVSGGITGIEANQQGLGGLSITSTGTVTGESEDGINAYVGATGTDLTINAFDINAYDNGVEARNYGSGNTSVTSTGTVTAGGAYGIGAAHYGAGGNLSISANNTSGSVYGIAARNAGSGSLAITSTGTATGGTHGIGAQNLEGSTDANVSAHNAYGGTYGVAINHYGSGALSTPPPVTSVAKVRTVYSHSIPQTAPTCPSTVPAPLPVDATVFTRFTTARAMSISPVAAVPAASSSASVSKIIPTAAMSISRPTMPAGVTMALPFSTTGAAMFRSPPLAQ